VADELRGRAQLPVRIAASTEDVAADQALDPSLAPDAAELDDSRLRACFAGPGHESSSHVSREASVTVGG